MDTRSDAASPLKGEAFLASAVAEDADVSSPRCSVVLLTTFFPNPRDPHRTVFVRNLATALREYCDLRVIAPVAKRPPIGAWREHLGVPMTEEYEGFHLVHPRYLAIPGFHWLAGLSYFAGIWRILRRLRREHGAFVLHAHCGYPDAVGAAIAARLLRIPLVITVHGSDINISARKLLLRLQIRWALRRAQVVVAVSQALHDRVRRLTGLGPGHLTCIPCSGYSPDVFKPRAKPGLRSMLRIGDAGRVVVYVGHLFPVKGVDILVRAWSLLASPVEPARTLILIGEGSERDRLMRLTQELGIESQVRFLGPLPQREVADWIAAADLLCLPSHSEGSPNVVVEALASGIPVVASRVGGVPELVVDGLNGMLVPPADPSQLADALSAALARQWDAQAISASIAHLTWDALAKRNYGTLQRVALKSTYAIFS